MRLKPDVPAEYLMAQIDAAQTERMEGWIKTDVYQSVEDPRDVWLIAMFDSEESYRANAESEAQHSMFMMMRACLDSDPEWHDAPRMFQQDARAGGLMARAAAGPGMVTPR
jgi:quinol monooxygenase YgiN